MSSASDDDQLGLKGRMLAWDVARILDSYSPHRIGPLFFPLGGCFEVNAWFRDELVPLYAENGLSIRLVRGGPDNWLYNLFRPIEKRTFMEMTLLPDDNTSWLASALLERWYDLVVGGMTRSNGYAVDIVRTFCTDEARIAWYDAQLLPYLRARGLEASIEYTAVRRPALAPYPRRLDAKVSVALSASQVCRLGDDNGNKTG